MSEDNWADDDDNNFPATLKIKESVKPIAEGSGYKKKKKVDSSSSDDDTGKSKKQKFNNIRVMTQHYKICPGVIDVFDGRNTITLHCRGTSKPNTLCYICFNIKDEYSKNNGKFKIIKIKGCSKELVIEKMDNFGNRSKYLGDIKEKEVGKFFKKLETNTLPKIQIKRDTT